MCAVTYHQSYLSQVERLNKFPSTLAVAVVVIGVKVVASYILDNDMIEGTLIEAYKIYIDITIMVVLR